MIKKLQGDVDMFKSYKSVMSAIFAVVLSVMGLSGVATVDTETTKGAEKLDYVAHFDMSVQDEEAPVIEMKKGNFEVEYEEDFEITDHIELSDNLSSETVLWDNLTVTEYQTDKLGETIIELYTKDAAGNGALEKVVLEVVDTTAPKINVEEEVTTLTEGDDVDIMAGVTAEDNVDGDLTDDIEVDIDVDADTPGEYTVTYTAVDSSNNKAEATKKFVVEAKPEPVVEQNTESTEASSGSQSSSSTNKSNAPKEEKTEAQESSYDPMTINFNGKSVPLKNGGVANGQAIIDSGPYASTWGGAETFSGTDGLNTHIIGHNPGPFAGIWTANEIVVVDEKGTPFTYQVTDRFKLRDGKVQMGTDKTEGWEGVVNPNRGEMISVQTCVTGSDTMNWIIEAHIVN